MITRRALLTMVLAGALLPACTRGAAPPVSGGRPPIVVQGAMDSEIRKLAGAIDRPQEERVGGWTFWVGTLDGYPVVISKTLKGMENAAAATTLAAEHYHPLAIVNQGTAGGHQPDLHVYDIILGTETVNLGSFKTGTRARGAGSNVAEWDALDLMHGEGSSGPDPGAHVMRRFRGDEGMLAAARSVKDRYTKGRVVDGVIGSSEVWNSELDRIQAFHDRYGTSAEEMEAASVAQIAGLFKIPFLAIRVLSNNITNNEAHDPRTGPACEDYVVDVVKAYIHQKVHR